MSWRGNMRRVLFTVVLCTAGLVPASAAAGAAPDRLYRMVERVQDLNEAGASWAQIGPMLEDEFGLVVAETTATAVPVAAPGSEDVTMGKAYLTYDDKTHDTYAFATMQWRDCGGSRCWHRDAGTNGAGDHGGPDGFALWSERRIAIHSHYLQLSDPCGLRETLKNAEFREPYGVGFRRQDTEAQGPGRCRQGTYNFDGASLGAQITWNDGHGGDCLDDREFELRAKYGHTWETTSLNSIGISETGISFSWNDKPHHFDVTSPPNVIRRCR
jgi:hypothetical protein